MTATPSQQRETLAIEAAVQAACDEAGWEWDVEMHVPSPQTCMAPIIDAARPLLPETRALERVRALCFASDDGSEYKHETDCNGDANCPACWALSIRNAIEGGER